MFKTLFKIALIVAAGYVLLKVPAFKNYAESIRADILKKISNVTAEVDRVKNQVEEKKKAVEDTVNTVTEAAGKIKKGVEAVNAILPSAPQVTEKQKTEGGESGSLGTQNTVAQ